LDPRDEGRKLASYRPHQISDFTRKARFYFIRYSYPKNCDGRFVAPYGSRNQRAAAVDFRRGNNLRIKKERGRLIVHARFFVIAAPVWSGVCCSIYCLVVALVSRLELRALPLTVSFADSANIPQAC
ncbi:MAG: hypothetical protein J5582_02710, partial [Ruminococcus sp.]|uniref:hypothetical protein n=1 Tax=Ruminococcus sp. TaxID=41978 RepID=UPI0025EE4008